MVESSYKHIVVVCGFLLPAIHTQMLIGDFVFAEAVPFQNRSFDPCSVTPNEAADWPIGKRHDIIFLHLLSLAA